MLPVVPERMAKSGHHIMSVIIDIQELDLFVSWQVPYTLWEIQTKRKLVLMEQTNKDYTMLPETRNMKSTQGGNAEERETPTNQPKKLTHLFLSQ